MADTPSGISGATSVTDAGRRRIRPRPRPHRDRRHAHIIYRIHRGAAPAARPVAALRRLVTRTAAPNIREVHAVKGVSFTAYRGEAIGLIGSNGSGKSTLLRAIAGLLPVDRGAIYTQGQPSLLGVNAALLNDLSGERNVVLGCLAMGMHARRGAAADPGDHRVLRDQRAGRLRLACRCGRTPPAWRPGCGSPSPRRRSTTSCSSTRRSPPATSALPQAQRAAGHGSCATAPARSSWSATSSARIRDTCERTIWLESGVIRMDGPTDEVVPAYEDVVSK